MAVVAPTSMLTSLATLKAEMGIDPGDTSQDDYLTQLILRASAEVESYVDRTLGQQTNQIKTEIIDNRDNTTLRRRQTYLDVYPVDAVHDVQLAGDPLVLGEDYYVTPENGILHYTGNGIAKIHAEFAFNTATIVIDYDGGYVLPDDVDRDLPYDIESAVIGVAKMRFNTKDYVPIVKTEKVPDVLEMTYFGADMQLDAVRTMFAQLDPYRDLRV